MERDPGPDRAYLVRYGSMGQVGRFSADATAPFDRGATVVVRSHRGTELGEVLVEAPASLAADSPLVDGLARVLRVATPDDLARARRAEGERESRYEACRRVLGEGVWPLELVDVEPLLDDGRTVLHYLGPHRLDASGLLAVFRESCGLDVLFQAVGIDADPDEVDHADDHDHEHGCGAGGCGTGGGCGSGGCGTGSSCSDCGVKKLMSSARG